LVPRDSVGLRNQNQPTTVFDERLREAFLQGEEREAALLFREMLHRSVRLGLYEAMAEEVERLCGPRYKPDPESRFQRAGSEKGVAYLDGGKDEIRRPRVRHETEGEVRLATYAAASSPQGLFEQVVAAVAQGLPVRGVERALDGAVSKSEASRMWADKSREQLELLRGRPLDDADWLCVLIDGVWLTRELCVVVAVGIDTEGNKRVLDFEQGPSENTTTVEALLKRLRSRGVSAKAGRRLLVLRDGSNAIAAGVRRLWPDAVQQECLVHAHSNLRDQVRKRDRADLDLRFKSLREAQGKAAGVEAFDDLMEFVSERNAAAALALGARREVLLAFHRLEVPSTLNTTFLSTNLIENVLRNWREATGNVKRWNEKQDMVPRWMAAGLLWAEAGFRKIRHAEDLPRLAAALAPSAPSSGPAIAGSSSCTPSDRADQQESCPSTGR
jgi:putative transposase